VLRHAALLRRALVHGQRVGREQRELVGVLRAGFGVVEDEELPGGAGDRELLPVQRELADLRVVVGRGAALSSHDVVARP
jgi:hypothetical protein